MKKNEKMLRSMELVDEKYVAEADPTKVKRKKKHPKLLAFAACFVLLLTGLNLWLFIPFDTDPPDVSRYSDSEYYSIIQKLNAATYQKPLYKNNFEKYLANLTYILNRFDKDAAGENTSESPSEMGEGIAQYQEVTDNQVAGVIEADRIKRSDAHIYYLNEDGILKVYSIDGDQSTEVGSYSPLGESGMRYPYTTQWEIYLSADCKTVTVIAPHSSDKYNATVAVISLDVSDPEQITRKSRVDISGEYISSRMVDGELLLISGFYAGNPDFSDESTFLPQIDSGNGAESIPVDHIISPETLSSVYYTVITKLDEQTPTLADASAFLSYSEEVYVSTDTLYATRSYNDTAQDSEGYTVTVAMTEISALSYTGERFEYLGSTTVKGTVKNQYSLDEYEGILRVVTTTNFNRRKESINGELASVTLDRRNGTSASLYCIDLSTWKVIAEVADFAPKGETVESVRFDGDSAYVCTAVVVTLTDPVFFFDLSDLDNITYKDTGVIEGYSSSLVNFGDGFLLGIGVGNWSSNLKLEIYREAENGVESVCTYEDENTFYSTDYKSYLIDRENRLIGLGVDDYNYYNADVSRYLLFTFDGYELIKLVDEPLEGNNAAKRAVYIDGYLYMFGANGMSVKQVSE